MKKHLVFVYGSLKAGFENHRTLTGADFVMSTQTSDMYYMLSYGAYPAVTDRVRDYFINGEVYEVTDEAFRAIDALESNGKYYERKKIRVDGIKESVWCYFIIHPDFTEDDGFRVLSTQTHQSWEKRTPWR